MVMYKPANRSKQRRLPDKPRDRNVTTHKLFTFVKIADSRNISQAAKTLGVSQPTVTVNLQRLEDTLGVTLFHRAEASNDYQISLTPEGQALLPFARKALRYVDLFRSAAESLSNGESISTHRVLRNRDKDILVNLPIPQRQEEPGPPPDIPEEVVRKAIADLEEVVATGMLRTQIHVALRTIIDDLNATLESEDGEQTD